MTSNNPNAQILGTMTILEGQILKSDGELAGAERVAQIVQKMVAVGPLFPPPPQQAAGAAAGGTQQIPTGTIIDVPINNEAPSTIGSTRPAGGFEQLTVLYADHLYDIALGLGGGRSPKQQYKKSLVPRAMWYIVGANVIGYRFYIWYFMDELQVDEVTHQNPEASAFTELWRRKREKEWAKKKQEADTYKSPLHQYLDIKRIKRPPVELAKTEFPLDDH